MTGDTATSTISDFELAGKATSIEDVESTADQDLLEAFESIRRWGSEVTVNEHKRLLVGKTVDTGSKAYRLFHQPKDATSQGYAGLLIHRREYHRDGPDKHTLAFQPAGEGPEDQTALEKVNQLDVDDHGLTDRLDTVLPKLRTALTDSDWTEDGRADTRYEEWLKATGELVEYIQEREDLPFQFPAKLVMSPRVMHAIARYPLGAEEIMCQTSDSAESTLEDGIYEANPEAFRMILLDYAHHELD